MEKKILSSISPISRFTGNQPNNANTQTLEKKPSKYTDPLMNWPVRGMAFSNDIGAAIMDIAPKAGTAFWIPALMYFGADIYDKYRNDKDSYDPSARRGLKQAMFQTFASIVFPIAAVHAGQKVFSFAAKAGKNNLSLQTQEEVLQHHKEYMSHCKLREFTPETYKETYGKALDNYLDELMRREKTKNPLKILMRFTFGQRHPEHMGAAQRTKVHEFADKQIDKMFKIRESLLENKNPEDLPNKLFTQFQVYKEKYSKDPKHINDFVEKAAKDTLKALEDNKVFKIKMMKTVGGFIALGLLIKPIDKFVENVIIKKIVGPGLDKFNREQIMAFKEKVFR